MFYLPPNAGAAYIKSHPNLECPTVMQPQLRSMREPPRQFGTAETSTLRLRNTCSLTATSFCGTRTRLSLRRVESEEDLSCAALPNERPFQEVEGSWRAMKRGSPSHRTLPLPGAMPCRATGHSEHWHGPDLIRGCGRMQISEIPNISRG